LERRDELDRQIEQLALLPNLAPTVGRLQCFRGISLHSAMVLATEIVDWRRFGRSGQLACYLGLVSKEDSSGDRTRLGSWKHPGAAPLKTTAPNQVWTIDFKGQFRMRNGVYCYPLTIVDHFSRYVLCCQSFPDVKADGVHRQLRVCFARTACRTPFAATTVRPSHRTAFTD